MYTAVKKIWKYWEIGYNVFIYRSYQISLQNTTYIVIYHYVLKTLIVFLSSVVEKRVSHNFWSVSISSASVRLFRPRQTETITYIQFPIRARQHHAPLPVASSSDLCLPYRINETHDSQLSFELRERDFLLVGLTNLSSSVYCIEILWAPTVHIEYTLLPSFHIIFFTQAVLAINYFCFTDSPVAYVIVHFLKK